MPDTLLKIQNLKIASNNPHRLLIDNLSLTIKKQHSLALVGENGSGKTIITKAILGLLPDNCEIIEGNIFFEDQNLKTMSYKNFQKIRGRKIATVLQNAMGSLTPSMRIGAQIVETLRQHNSITKKEAYSKAIELLASVRIPNPERCFHLYPFELSGGMRQRTVIAISLASSPELILADEPTTALDSVSQAQVLRILRKVHKENNTAMLLVTHNLALVTELCDDIAIIKDGQLIETGSVKEIFSSPQHSYTKRLLKAVSKIPLTDSSSPILKAKLAILRNTDTL
ncbi:Glutathione import ATP-binding protein GsiA,oligopeptide transporter ATP-binding component,ABC-type oligopeptide transport system, ATPase component,nickel import ATP-binding protein NikD,ABC transporter [Chlamydia poikilotherma]|uniref:ABC transporter domain-containing protein n=1 Tax=Chlamydia poikilotherma TaxID=1967783 RepID=A0A3B0PPF9_9CHLA|nr:ABC transporter ATP-binding protein [Chlamydia poikilotherma]SYX09073.1 Glutathione import ATP-binding protein GsiA,oligopeptide transporter ATP-binding component,ABC-type oligopeptide transport system, ATPase component,nickel import ATP-binding protein NikD,ABC transporter [Chlamydia poikilotherma]